VREEMLDWLGRNHPHALPKISTAITDSSTDDRHLAPAGDRGDGFGD
jgi:hypothetical protein